MGKKLDIEGEKFGRLLVIRENGRNKHGLSLWECKCDCGNMSYSTGTSLVTGHKKSCGCIQKEIASKLRPVIHGESKEGSITPEYNTWNSIKRRCNNKNDKRYHDYGGRGITICDRWLKFENFLADMGRRPSSEHSIDRFPNINGNYEPGNCRWGTVEQQGRGKRNNRWLEYNGEKLILVDWAKKLNSSPGNILRSLKNGKPFNEIVEFYQNKKAA